MNTAATTTETVTCTRCGGKGYVEFSGRAGTCFLCDGSGRRPPRAQVIATNKARAAAKADRDARYARLAAAGLAAAEATADADGRKPMDEYRTKALVGQVVWAAIDDDSEGLADRYDARRFPILFAAVVAAVAAADKA